MKTTIFRARQMSLALLVVAVIDHGNLCVDCSGATPNSSGLVRLGRDLTRRAGRETNAEVSFKEMGSRNRRIGTPCADSSRAFSK
jgi:hypothetical protein